MHSPDDVCILFELRFSSIVHRGQSLGRLNFVSYLSHYRSDNILLHHSAKMSDAIRQSGELNLHTSTYLVILQHYTS